MERFCLIDDGTGSEDSGTGWYLVVLGREQNCLINDGTWSVGGGTCLYLVVLGQ